MLFNPENYTSTPTRLTEDDVHAVVVRCDYRDSIDTTKVKGGKGLNVYFGIVEDGARGIVLEKTFYTHGTQNDEAARNVLAAFCRTVGHTAPLTEENLAEWCADIALSTGPVKIVTQPDPKNPKFRRLQYVNKATGYDDAREIFNDQIEDMRAIAAKSADRLTLNTGGTEDVAL